MDETKGLYKNTLIITKLKTWYAINSMNAALKV